MSRSGTTARRKLLRGAIIVFSILALQTGDASGQEPSERVVFASNRSGNYDLYAMNLDGSSLTKLLGGAMDELQPDVSSDGSMVVFVRAAVNTACPPGGDLFISRMDGTGERALRSDPALDECRPRWSPDGSSVLFSAAPAGGSSANLFLVQADGSGLRQLTRDPVVTNYGAWSRDGRQIVFNSNRDGKTRLWLADSDGSNPRALTDPPAGADTAPVWSPDGRHIVFRTTRDGPAGELYSVAADGSGLRRLTNNSFEDRFPTWSPDSRTVVFASVRDVNCPAQAGVLCPSQLYSLSAEARETRITSPPFHDSYPVFVPRRQAAAPHGQTDGRPPGNDRGPDDGPVRLPLTGTSVLVLPGLGFWLLASGAVCLSFSRRSMRSTGV